MVAVGDKHPRFRQRTLNNADFVGRVDWPYLIDDARVVGHVDARLSSGGACEQPFQLNVPGRVKTENRTDVRARRGEQAEAILLGGREGAFMRQDAPRAEFFEPDSRDEPVADEPSLLQLKNLGVEVNRRVRGALDDSF